MKNRVNYPNLRIYIFTRNDGKLVLGYERDSPLPIDEFLVGSGLDFEAWPRERCYVVDTSPDPQFIANNLRVYNDELN